MLQDNWRNKYFFSSSKGSGLFACLTARVWENLKLSICTNQYFVCCDCVSSILLNSSKARPCKKAEEEKSTLIVFLKLSRVKKITNLDILILPLCILPLASTGFAGLVILWVRSKLQIVSHLATCCKVCCSLFK